MTTTYEPGPAIATVQKAGDKWTLVMTRELRHPPAKVWKAITKPEHLRQWAPYDADRDLGSVGAAQLTTVGAGMTSESQVTRAEAPKVLEMTWGGNEMRWELEPHGTGTLLKLWHNIDNRFIAMGAAGWHVCLDILDRALGDAPIDRIVGPEAMKAEAWQRLHRQYQQQFEADMAGRS